MSTLAPEHTAIFTARGPLSELLMDLLQGRTDRTDLSPLAPTARVTASAADDALTDDDLQLALFILYGLHYGSIPGVDDGWEWQPDLIAARRILEERFEERLRVVVATPDLPDATQDDVARALFELTAPTPGPSLSRFVAKTATLEQLREFLIQPSIYTLREADPHSWAIPRLTGRAKTALVEIQFDEYGSGSPARMHAGIFAKTMRGLGLDDSYAAYVDAVPAITLASQNMMSMFGLNRRLRGAIAGHLAAFEMTSSLPNRSYGDGFRRLGFDAEVTDYFDEHVEADAVHEQIAARDLAGALVADEPELLASVFFGAAACLALDELVADHIHDAWKDGRSSLREPGSAR